MNGGSNNVLSTPNPKDAAYEATGFDASGPRQNILLAHEILPHYDRSGADLRIFELARELSSEGHNVTFLARQDREKEKYASALEALGVKIVAGDPSRLRHLGEDSATPWELREVLEDGHFHTAILCHWYWNAISLAEHYLDEIRRWSPETCVMVLSEDRHGERERRAFPLSNHFSDLERGEDLEQRETEVYQQADLVLYVSEVDHRHYRKLLPELRAEHLPTIAEAGKTGPGFHEREGVLFLGNFENLANRDGLRWLVEEIWPRVVKEEPNLKLYVAGHALTAELCPQGKNIVLLGKVADLGEAFAGRRVFAGPVRYGTGIITKNMQSIAHRLPVVTTTVGGEGLQLISGVHALIADTPELFAASLLRLYREEPLWNALSQQGSSYIAENFNREKLSKHLRHILALAPTLPRKAFDPRHQWSYRRVESAVPEALSQQPARYRPQLRSLGYWQLGHALLEAGKPAEALEQFRHIFATLRDEIPTTVFHVRLLEEMSACYTAMHNTERASRCRKEAERLAKIASTSFARHSSAGKPGPEPAGKGPLLSVIIPAYNRRATLQLALAALSFQTLPASCYEVLVIDDGSTDGTEALCRTSVFSFGEIRYIQQQNGGAGSARNAGVEAASGKYLLFMNDDTVAAPTLLAEHLAVHCRNPRERWAILGSFTPTVECNRRALSLWLQRSTFLFPQNALQPGQLCDAAYFVTCNLSVARQAVIEAGSFDPTFRVGEDTELGIRLAAKGYRVKYHPAAQAVHEHPQFTAEDLLRRARTYGPVHVALFEKHPQLVQRGNSPFGRLSPEDYARMEREIKDKRAAVDSALAGLRALDQLDLFELARKQLLDDAQLQQLINQVGQLVPMVYWITLFESFLQAAAAHAHVGGAEQT